jgi:hypothetical protein
MILASMAGVEAVQRVLTDSGGDVAPEGSSTAPVPKDDQDIDQTDLDNDGVPDFLEHQFKTFNPVWRIDYPKGGDQTDDGFEFTAWSVAQYKKESVIMIPQRWFNSGTVPGTSLYSGTNAASDHFYGFEGPWNLAELHPDLKTYAAVVEQETSFVQSSSAAPDNFAEKAKDLFSGFTSSIGKKISIGKDQFYDAFEWVEETSGNWGTKLNKAFDIADDAVEYIETHRKSAAALRNLARRLLLDKKQKVLSGVIHMEEDLNNDGELNSKDLEVKVMSHTPMEVDTLFENTLPWDDENNPDGPDGPNAKEGAWGAILIKVKTADLASGKFKKLDVKYPTIANSALSGLNFCTAMSAPGGICGDDVVDPNDQLALEQAELAAENE